MNHQTLFSLILLTACTNTDEEKQSSYTYYGDAKSILDTRCATCHQTDDIAPFPLTTYEEIEPLLTVIRTSIETGSMPPWKPSDECNDYKANFDLTADEKSILLDWIDNDAPIGDPDNYIEPSVDTSRTFETNMSLQIPESYTPTRGPDDYRCHLIPWPNEETSYVTGINVIPEQTSIVHHVILFLVGPDQVEQFQAYDDAEEGPGYTCYGGPRANTGDSTGGLGLGDINPSELLSTLNELGLTIGDLQSGNYTSDQLIELFDTLGASTGGAIGGFNQIGNWVPGTPPLPYPEGTGIRVEPGSMIVAQMHYNTLSADPVSDQSSFQIATTPEVEKEAILMLLTDFGWVSQGMLGPEMTIPAGESNVEHGTIAANDSVFVRSARRSLGLEADAPLMLYTAGAHMHTLGVSQHSEIQHEDGGNTCLLDIQDWDFSWQGAYHFSEPIPFGEGDSISMTCSWDNSASNQQIIDGTALEPIDVQWGEGTTDEMCLGGFYVTSQ